MKRTTPSHFRPPFGSINSSRSYWLTRFLILRLLGIVYAVAFLVAINQIVPLIGSHGLLPVEIYLDRVRTGLGSGLAGFLRLPSLFWFIHSDTALLVIAWLGFLLSIVLIAGFANAPLMTILWFFYMSFVHIGQEWYGYGWEIQLLETGFLAIFLCPLIEMKPFPKRAPPFVIIVLFRWLIFRIMMGSGLIKFRGDEIWRNGTALYYHFETQPLPGPLSSWFHFLPKSILRAGVLFNWLAELVAPIFVFWPRMLRHFAGVIIILFQFTIILSGNLSFLNWLTIVPAIACLDDDFWKKILPQNLVQKAKEAQSRAVPSRGITIGTWIVACLIILLSVQPAFNLLSSRQIMNTSYDPFELVNTYGAFGSVGEKRFNIIFEGTDHSNPLDTFGWKPYAYKSLPVSLDQMPPQIAPYQLRLDWQMWFAAMSSPEDYPWVYNLIWKLLNNDPNAVGLFASNPFPQIAPTYIRATLYQYSFAKPGNPKHNWWQRQRLGTWIAPLSIRDSSLTQFLKSEGWLR
ncbi:lipase maturation factor family protein [Hanamia caeni]|uniref:Lipase maturation factor family protein n=1 Tax=Hanamia caeni TaxID=2294116 RepID=A0A3M9NKG6_9BACT|nr:lipase maturation factor family protein [Hanamia caeni]RNI38201.1 lipase maturation factor family protein [Hanamia caeni]